MRELAICPRFAAKQEETLFKALKSYFDYDDLGMSKAAYIEMCGLSGETPDPEKMPVEFNEFPWYVVKAIEIFNGLPDMISDMTYIGKDLSSLEYLMELYEVDKTKHHIVFTIIKYLEGRVKEKGNKRNGRK